MQGYKTDFPLLMQDKTVYIDNAATAQRPKCVIDAEKDFTPATMQTLSVEFMS